MGLEVKSLDETTLERWGGVLDVNSDAPWYCPGEGLGKKDWGTSREGVGVWQRPWK